MLEVLSTSVRLNEMIACDNYTLTLGAIRTARKLATVVNELLESLGMNK